MIKAMKYELLAYLQFDFDTDELDELLEQENDNAILTLASEYDFGQKGEVREYATLHPNDSVIAENDSYIVVKNYKLGTWEILRKVKED